MIALLALLAAAPTPGVQGRLRTTIVVEERPSFDPLTGELVLVRRAPIIEDLMLDATTAIEGLTVALDAWAAVEAGERSLAEPTIADVTEGWIRWQTTHATLSAGRLFLFMPGARAMRVDGGRAKLHPKWAPGGVRLFADLFGGLVVTPRYGDEALRTARARAARSPLELAPAGSDWLRPGDWSFGGTAGASFWGYVEAEGGYLMVRDLDSVDREAVVARVSILPLPRLRIEGFGSLDLYAGAVEEAEFGASYWLSEVARANVYGRLRRPDLLLPSTSILSVFGGAAHSELGLEVDLFPEGLYRVSASGGARLTDVVGAEDRALGAVSDVSVQGPLPGWDAARGRLEWSFATDEWNGAYHLGRLGLELPILSWLGASLDAGVSWLDLTGVSGLAWGGGASTRLSLGGGWSVVLSVRGSERPDAISDLALIGRVEWNTAREL